MQEGHPLGFRTPRPGGKSAPGRGNGQSGIPGIAEPDSAEHVPGYRIVQIEQLCAMGFDEPTVDVSVIEELHLSFRVVSVLKRSMECGMSIFIYTILVVAMQETG
jgi:hypothetical protein